MMPKAEYYEESGRIVLETEFIDRHAVAEIPGTTYTYVEGTSDKLWSLPLCWSSCVSLREVFGADLEIGERLQEWAWKHRQNVVEPALGLRSSLEPTHYVDGKLSSADGTDLYPFQKAGVEFLLTVGSGILADDMGLGKSVQSIYTVRESQRLNKDALPLLVVCPNSVKHQWVSEIHKWSPEWTVTMVDGSAAKRRKQLEQETDVYIINWESLRAHTRLAPFGSIALSRCEECRRSYHKGTVVTSSKCETCLKELNVIEWGSVIADEAHRAKNPMTKTTRALWGASDKANYRIALTGTPVSNRPDELWALLRFIDPNQWNSKSKWVDFFLQKEYNIFGGVEIYGIRPERSNALFATVDPVLRRTKKDRVLTQLPQRIYRTVEVELGAKQRKPYEQMRKTMLAQLDNGEILHASKGVVKMLRLVQAASATMLSVNEDGTIELGAPSCKIDALEDIVTDFQPERSFVVFVNSRALIDLAAKMLDKHGITYGQVHGGRTTFQRDEDVQQFQAGNLQGMLCTFKAGGTGLTLTRADTAIFLQRSFSPVENEQAEGRVHRIGSEIHDSIEFIDVVAHDTVESRIHQLLEDKGIMVEQIMRDKMLMENILNG